MTLKLGLHLPREFDGYRFSVNYVKYTDKTAITCRVSHGPTPVDVTVTYEPSSNLYDLDELHRKVVAIASKSEYLIEEYAVELLKTIVKDVRPRYAVVQVCGNGPNHPRTCVSVSAS